MKRAGFEKRGRTKKFFVIPEYTDLDEFHGNNDTPYKPLSPPPWALHYHSLSVRVEKDEKSLIYIRRILNHKNKKPVIREMSFNCKQCRCLTTKPIFCSNCFKILCNSCIHTDSRKCSSSHCIQFNCGCDLSLIKKCKYCKTMYCFKCRLIKCVVCKKTICNNDSCSTICPCGSVVCLKGNCSY